MGALQYVITRSNIAFSVNKVGQFIHCPLDTHLKAIKRILRYLKGAQTSGMAIKWPLHLSLVGFSDGDWGSNPDDCRRHIIVSS